MSCVAWFIFTILLYNPTMFSIFSYSLHFSWSWLDTWEHMSPNLSSCHQLSLWTLSPNYQQSILTILRFLFIIMNQTALVWYIHSIISRNLSKCFLVIETLGSLRLQCTQDLLNCQLICLLTHVDIGTCSPGVAGVFCPRVIFWLPTIQLLAK